MVMYNKFVDVYPSYLKCIKNRKF